MWRTLDSTGRLKTVGSVGPTGPTGPTGSIAFTTRCSAFNSTGQTGITGAVPLTLDSEDFDATAMHSTGSNTSRITVAASGTFFIQGYTTAQIPATGSPILALELYKNGSFSGLLLQTCQLAVASTGLPMSLAVGGLYVLAANDYVELYGAASNATTFGGILGAATRLQVAQVA